jgi:hypothetical protein
VFKLFVLTVFSSLVMAGETDVPLALIKQYEAKLKTKYQDFSDKKKSQLYLHAASEMLERHNLEGAHYLASQAFSLGGKEEKLHSCIIQTETSFRLNNGILKGECLDSFTFQDSKNYPVLYTDILRLKLLRSDQLSKKTLSKQDLVFLLTEGYESTLSAHDAKVYLKNRNFNESLKLMDKIGGSDMMLIDKVARDMVAWLAGDRKDFTCSAELKEYGAHYTEALEVCSELHKMGKIDKSIVQKFAKSLEQDDFQVQMIIKEFLKI